MVNKCIPSTDIPLNIKNWIELEDNIYEQNEGVECSYQNVIDSTFCCYLCKKGSCIDEWRDKTRHIRSEEIEFYGCFNEDLLCSNSDCNNLATTGAHVYLDQMKKEVFIVPSCSQHNTKDDCRIFPIRRCILALKIDSCDIKCLDYKNNPTKYNKKST